MCGIVGYCTPKAYPHSDLLVRMSERVAHRGPDGSGYWCWPSENAHHLALGHRRFALLDQSPAGAQPMQRAGLTLVFNGEIYNHAALRTQLEALGTRFYSRSDTEVLLEAWRTWGRDCLPKLRGFFAFALFDAPNQALWLVRDPLGKAPLYWIHKPDFVCFASDIKPLLTACPEEKTKLRDSAITDYLHQGLRDFEHQTFWQNINSLPAGSWTKIQVQSAEISTMSWWQMPSQRRTPAEIPIDEAISGLQTRLHEAVALRMSSDRKIGFTLSGGLDSSALLAIACQHLKAGEKLPVLTIGYADKTQDETRYARMVIQRYATQTEHFVLDGFERTVLEDWDHFMDIQEEPYHDPVLYADYLQQKQLKKMGMDVCITGAGGDELLAGYPSFLLPHIRNLWRGRGWMHAPEILKDLAMLADSFSLNEWLGIWNKRNPPVTQLFKNESIATPLSQDLHTQILQKMGHHQMNYWLRSLQKTYMSVPVEPRLPLLDQSLVEYCMQLPLSYLIQGGWPKYILRKAAAPYLPTEVVWRRKKMGFPFDTRQWLLQHEAIMLEKLQNNQENHWVNIPFARKHYQRIAHNHPQLLWRTVCFVAWWESLMS